MFKRALSVLLTVMIAVNTLSVSAFSLKTDALMVTAVESPERFENNGTTLELSDVVDIDEFRAYLFEQLSECPDEVDVTSFNIPFSEDMKDAVCNFIWYDMPEVFHVNSLGLRYFSGGNISHIVVTYDYEADEFEQKYAKCEQAAAELLVGIDGNNDLTDVEKALLIHDRLALLCYYSSAAADHRYDMYGVFGYGTAVCQGYAMAYMFLLNKVGITNYYCSSKELNHGWNIVYINGIPYHVDVTWDDIAWLSTEIGVEGAVKHTNFLRSTNGMKSTGHTASDYYSVPVDTTYDNYFWQNSEAAFLLVDGEIYYINNSDATLNRLGDSDALCSVTDSWSGTSANKARLSTDGVNLYYSLSDSVYKYDPATDTATNIYQPSLSSGYSVFGMTYVNDGLLCDINNVPPSGQAQNLYQLTQAYDGIAPDVSVSSTNSLASSQTVSLTLSDNVGLAGLYWGTDTVYSNNSYTSIGDGTEKIKLMKTVTVPGRYYYTAVDAAGNVSKQQWVDFYKTTLDAKGGEVSASSVLTAGINTLTFPTPTKEGYKFLGWNTSADAAGGITSVTPVSNQTYYAIWEALSLIGINVSKLPTKTIYYLGDTLDISGMELQLINYNNTTETLTSGFLVSGFDSQRAGTKTLTVSYSGFTDTFTVTVKTPSVALSASKHDLYISDSFSLNAVTSPANLAVIWSSSNTSVATVDENGTVTALKRGTATIMATTVNGGFTDSCEVNVVCIHSATTVHPAVVSTCITQGNNAYTTCDGCGEMVSGSDAKLPLSTVHRGGTATCTQKAVCTVCSKAYGDYASHNLIHHAAVAADYNHGGNIEYWSCSGCNKYFADAAASRRTTADAVKTAALVKADDTDTKPEVSAADTSKIFNDVKNKWYKAAIDYNYNHGFISGMSKTTFGINTPVTRGMFITVLARIAGVDTSANKVSTVFTDVKIGKYYTAAIKWASENKIVSGITPTTYEPDTKIERQQLCVMIVNFANNQGITINAKEAAIDFADSKSISKYAKKAVLTSQTADIVNGYNEGGKYLFKPKNTASRAEAAQILYKFHKEFIA